MSQAAAAVELAVALDERERIGVPILASDRHDVGMTGERDAARRRWPMVANRLALRPSGVGTRWLAMPCSAR